jgi:hypothetical protein
MMTTLLEEQRSTSGHVQSLAEVTLDQVLSRIAALARTLSKVGDCRRSSLGAGPSRRGPTVVAHPRHYVMAGAAVLARLSCVPVP